MAERTLAQAGPTARRARRDAVVVLARQQGGVVHLSQVRALGVSWEAVSHRVRTGFWQQPHPTLVIPGPEPLRDRGRIWAAHLLARGRGAIGGEAALWTYGLRRDCPPQVLLYVDERTRAPRAPEWITVHRRRGLDTLRHPATTPARLRVEVLVLDLVTPESGLNDVAALLTRVCQQRLTTPERLKRVLSARRFQPQRRLLEDMLGDIAEGAHSAMEVRYLRDVERAHGLPRAERNIREATASGVRYRDLRYRRYRLAVELDGALYHPEALRHLDQWRDNELLVDGVVTLRYRWSHLSDPCAIALQVAQVLRGQGWTGRPTECGPTCRLRLSA